MIVKKGMRENILQWDIKLKCYELIMIYYNGVSSIQEKNTRAFFARVMCQIITRSTRYEAMTTGSFFNLQLGHPKIQTNNEN